MANNTGRRSSPITAIVALLALIVLGLAVGITYYSSRDAKPSAKVVKAVNSSDISFGPTPSAGECLDRFERSKVQVGDTIRVKTQGKNPEYVDLRTGSTVVDVIPFFLLGIGDRPSGVNLDRESLPAGAQARVIHVQCRDAEAHLILLYQIKDLCGLKNPTRVLEYFGEEPIQQEFNRSYGVDPCS